MGLHRHTEEIREEYPEPLAWLLVELAEFNREKWLAEDSPRKNTYGADEVRETGLTTNEQEWAAKVAKKMENGGDDKCAGCGEGADLFVDYRWQNAEYSYCLDCAPGVIREYRDLVEP